jgi:hypothetical protein
MRRVKRKSIDQSSRQYLREMLTPPSITRLTPMASSMRALTEPPPNFIDRNWELPNRELRNENE